MKLEKLINFATQTYWIFTIEGGSLSSLFGPTPHQVVVAGATGYSVVADSLGGSIDGTIIARNGIVATFDAGVAYF